MLLEFQERIIMEEKWWNFVLKGECGVHNTYTRVARDTDKDLVLMKKDFLYYVQDVRRMRQYLSDHYVVLSKVRLVGRWIKRREVVDGVRSIRNEKLRRIY